MYPFYLRLGLTLGPPMRVAKIVLSPTIETPNRVSFGIQPNDDF